MCVTKDSLATYSFQSPTRLESIQFITTRKHITAQRYYGKAVLGHIYLIAVLSAGMLFPAFVRDSFSDVHMYSCNFVMQNRAFMLVVNSELINE